MKISAGAGTFLLAFSLLVPAMPVRAADASLGADNARHLLNRTGFAASDDDIAAFAKLNRADAADQLLKSARSMATQSPPAWVNDPPMRLRDMSPE